MCAQLDRRAADVVAAALARTSQVCVQEHELIQVTKAVASVCCGVVGLQIFLSSKSVCVEGQKSLLCLRKL